MFAMPPSATIKDEETALDIGAIDNGNATIDSIPRSASSRTLRPRPENRSITPLAPKRRRSHGAENAGGEIARKKLKAEVVEEKPLKVVNSKLEEKKARTIANADTKADFGVARKRWIFKHRHVFAELLPARNKFLENLYGELSSVGDNVSYVPHAEIDTQPSLVKGGEMKDYQLVGLSFFVWMHRNGMSCILGDEMGLGKTLQTLSLFAYIKENMKGPHAPHLVVCPLSVITSWMNEAARWVPSLKILRWHGSQGERESLKLLVRDSEEQFDVIVTTYDSYKSNDSWFKTRRWTYCVLDEGHKIKNPESDLARSLQGLGAQFRLILSGTPVHNNLTELWGLLHWLYPTIFTAATQQNFKDAFDLSRGKYDVKFLGSAQKLLEIIMLRRTKSAVELSVPPRDELTVFIPFTETQRFWTYKILTQMDAGDLNQIFNVSLTNEEAGRAPAAEGRYKRLMNLLMQLRQCCDHPYIIEDAEPDPFINGEHLVSASSKLIVLDKLLKEILPKNERVLVFSQWTSMLNLLEDFMQLRGIPYGRLDGATPRARRNLDIKLFQQEKSPFQVFLISTRAGGLGINLTKANHVVMIDSDWNPQSDLQAVARAHRIGQTKTVKVYRLICRGSVEDQMLDRIRRKLFLSVKIMNGDSSSGDSNSALRTNELLSILRQGSALGSDKDAMDLKFFLSSSIDDILQSSRERQHMRDEKMKYEIAGEKADAKALEDAAAEEQRLLSGVAHVKSRLFEGKLHQNPKKTEDLTSRYSNLGKRVHTKRLVKINGIPSFVLPDALTRAAPPKAQKKDKFDHEEWCLHCQDGGTLFLCTFCPRVFHAECYGMSEQACIRAASLSCSQHRCLICLRAGPDAGGMLFRCKTCPAAFCEDCLPEGELNAIGDFLPEFVQLGYGRNSAVYYIKCQDCTLLAETEPEALVVDVKPVLDVKPALPEIKASKTTPRRKSKSGSTPRSAKKIDIVDLTEDD